MSFADSVVNGTYGKKKKTNNFAEDVINGTFETPIITTNKVSEEVAPIKEEKKSNSWLNSAAFDDGYQFGDISKSLLGTADNIFTNLTSGALGVGEKTIDAGATVIGTLADKFGNKDLSNNIKEFVKKDLIDEEAIAKNFHYNPTLLFNKLLNGDKETTFLGDKTQSIVESGGQLGTQILLQSVGIPWWTTAGTTSFGEEAEHAFQSNADYNQALFSGLVSAGAEILTEKISGGISFGGKTLDAGLKSQLTKNISNRALNTLMQYGIDIAGEGFEEVASDFLQTLGRKLSYEKQATWDELLNNEEAMNNYIQDVADSLFGKEARQRYAESFIGGATLGGIMNLPRVQSSIKNDVNYENNYSKNEEALYNSQYKERIEEAKKSNSNLTKEEINEIDEELKKEIENGQLELDTIEESLGGDYYTQYAEELQKQQELEESIEALENMKANEITVKQQEELKSLREELESQNQTVKDLKNNLSNYVNELTQNDNYLRKSYDEYFKRGNTFNEDLTKIDPALKDTYQRAIDSGILNNTNRTHEFVNLLARLENDKGIKFDFINNEKLKDTLFALDGKQVNGYVDNGTIVLNMDSNKALNQVVGHEITHVLEGTDIYQELKNAVKEYATTRGEYEAKLNDIKELYKEVKDANIENELTSDLIGEYLFTDEDFVNNLSKQNRNIFQRIFDEIKYLTKLFTTGSKEGRQLEKLKHTFERVYRQQSSNLPSNIKFDIENSSNSEYNKPQIKRNYSTVEEAIKDDPRKSIYKKYNSNVDFFNLDYNEMRKAIAIGSKAALEAQKLGLDNYSFNDDKYNYDFDIIDKSNNAFGITNVDVIDNISKEVANETDPSKNSKYTLESSKYEEGLSDSNNKSTKNRKTSNRNVELPTKEQGKQGTNENRQLVENKKANSRELDNSSFSNVKYSISQDNQGRKLSKQQQEYFKDSKATDEKGNLITVYHTTTKEGPQFNEFNPVGTEYYRFGNQVVNYYTNSKDMSGSYADQDYIMADTKKITSMKEVNDYIKTMNTLGWGNYRNYELIQEDGKYKLIDNTEIPNIGKTRKQIYKEANEYKSKLSQEELAQFKDMFENEIRTGRVYDIDTYLKNKGYAFGSKEDAIAQKYLAIDNKNFEESGIYFDVLMRNAKYHTIETFDSKEQLFKKLKDLGSSLQKRQYEGYVNITNPYIVDAEKRNWNQVISQSNEFIDELDERVPEEIKNNLTRLYRESEEKSDDLRTKYNLAERFVRGTNEYLKTNKNSDALQKVLNRIGADKVNLVASGNANGLGVDTYYGLAEELENAGIIGKETAKIIIDDFKIPESVQKWVNNNYNKKLQAKDLYPQTNVLVRILGKNSVSLKELYENSNKAYEEFDKYRMPNSYFLEQISADGNDYLGNDLEDMFETRAEIYSPKQVGEEIAQAASVGFSKPELIRLWGTSKTTNDIVKEVIASNKDGLTNYDGVIIENVYDYGGKSDAGKQSNNLYVTFNSNQFKAVDNLTPTEDADIRYSISNQDEDIAPIGNYQIKGKDIKLQDIAPIENTKAKKETKTKEKVETKIELPINPTKEEAYENKKTRAKVREELNEEMGITTDDLEFGKDISSLGYQRTDPIRLNEKVFGAKIAKKINDATIRKTNHNEAERTRFLNKEREEIKNLGIKARSKESAAVQKYGEKQYVTDKGEVVPYTDADLAREFKDEATRNKIKNAAKVIREKYDTYIDEINKSITSMGYDPIPKRPDYMRHFQEINDKLSQWGIPLNRDSLSKDALPTDINGITDQFKPGKNWFASAMQRKGFKTTYDAITGIDGYLEGASNLMFHTADIQRYRTLSKMIRDTYGQTHGLDNIDLNTKEGKQRLNNIMDNKLSKYAAWLDEQANALAGKKGGIDRAAERILGRKIYTIADTAKKQVGSNMTGFNVRSALTNFASAIQGASKTNKLAFIKGTISTVKNMIHNDGLIEKSDFLTNRFGSDNLSKKLWQKISNAGQIFMTGTDYFTANQIWRSKYYENLSNGMSETEAIKNADDFASRVMGDRSKGMTAEIFNSKTLGLLTQFQLEVNNQWSSIIHDNKIDVQSGNKSGATVMFQLGQLAAMSYMFNNFMKAVTGSDVMLDPIDMIKELFGANDDDDEETTLEERSQKVLGELVNNLPFASFMSGGRIPIQEAFTGVGTAFNKLTGQKDKYGNDITWDDVKNDAITSAAYWLLPTGYGQAKKTAKGMSMYNEDLPIAGSYTDTGNLKFTADDSIGGKIKAALFGEYSQEEAQKYRESGYKTVNKNNIQELIDLNMNTSEYKKYKEDLKNAGTTNAEKIDFISNSNYTNDQKNIMAENVLGKEFNMNKYKNYGSYEEADYAIKNPDKYLTSKVISNTFDNYKNYINTIKDIESDETATRKEKVIDFIDNLNEDYGSKIILYRMYYPKDNSYNTEIVDYLNNSNRISIDEEKKILKYLGMEITDDGTVRW